MIQETLWFLKAMLYGTTFLATCNAAMTAEKHCKSQRGCHTFSIFISQLATRPPEIVYNSFAGRQLEIPLIKGRALIGSF